MNDFKQRYHDYQEGYRCWPNELPDGYSCDEQNGWFDAQVEEWDPPLDRGGVIEIVEPKRPRFLTGLALAGIIGIFGGVLFLLWLVTF